jgi:hypothetical protein
MSTCLFLVDTQEGKAEWIAATAMIIVVEKKMRK